MLRRVRKEEVEVMAMEKPDGLAYCLDCWKSYMEGDDRDLSASRMKLHAREDDDDNAAGYESDPYGEQRRADLIIGEATNAMIESLKTISRWAIHRKCGIVTAWQYPRADFLQALSNAETELEEKLKKNIATAIMF